MKEKKMKRILVPIFALLIITAVWAQAEAEDWKGNYRCPLWGTDLNLTQDQQDNLLDIQKNYRKNSEKIWLDKSRKELELRELYMADKPDLKKIEKAEDQIRDLMNKRYELSREHRTKMRSVLTTEQLQANPNAFICPGFGMGPGSGTGFGPGSGMGGGFGGFNKGGGGGPWR